jgi:tetratricopeptide (TPR) repeat protein
LSVEFFAKDLEAPRRTRRSGLLIGALFLTCAPVYAHCPNQACRAVADRCGAAEDAYTKQITDATDTIAHSATPDEDAVGPLGDRAIAAADALVRLWENGDCAVMMHWGKVAGQAGQLADQKSDAAGLRVMRGNGHLALDDLDSANADFSQAIALNPKNAEAYNGRGNVYRREGDLDRAIADSSQAIVLNPKLKFAYTNRGVTYQLKGDLDRAIADYNHAS